MRYLVLLVLGFAVSGCGSSGFAKPGAEYSEFYADLTECERENTPDSSWCFGRMCGYQEKKKARRRNHCMMARGWELTRDGERFVP